MKRFGLPQRPEMPMSLIGWNQLEELSSYLVRSPSVPAHPRTPGTAGDLVEKILDVAVAERPPASGTVVSALEDRASPCDDSMRRSIGRVMSSLSRRAPESASA